MSWLTADIATQLAWGVFWTVIFTLLTSAFSLIIGISVGTVRIFGNTLSRRLAAIYIAIHRNVPALVLIIFWAFAVPNLFSATTRSTLFFNNGFVDALTQLTSLSIPYYALAALLGLTLNTSAYIAELFRSGVGTLAAEQLDAARSLGASRLELFLTILLPEGVRTTFPAITTRLVHGMKNTALAALVAVPEFFNAMQGAISYTFRATQLLFIAAVVYLTLAFLFTTGLGFVERRLNQRRPFSVI